MTALYDADNAGNWEQIHSASFVVTYSAGQHVPIYEPIPYQELAVDISSSLVAIHCTSSDFPNQIRYLGRVVQSIVTSGTLPTNVATGNSVSLYSNRTVLADFTKFDDVYRLLLMPKFEVEQLTISVYEYVGSVYYELEQKLNVIESKIDNLS